MNFTKMHGAANDYVYIDCFADPAPADPAALAPRIADRHRGVGGGWVCVGMGGGLARAPTATRGIKRR
jgi:diaminopimelate epimerase